MRRCWNGGYSTSNPLLSFARRPPMETREIPWNMSMNQYLSISDGVVPDFTPGSAPGTPPDKSRSLARPFRRGAQLRARPPKAPAQRGEVPYPNDHGASPWLPAALYEVPISLVKFIMQHRPITSLLRLRQIYTQPRAALPTTRISDAVNDAK